MLVVFQAIDAAGKDGTIKHVMSGLNPQGVEVTSFKLPSAEELDHNYLWRYAKRVPERGRIGIFNRSYYEEVLVVRVHPEILERQQLPEECARRRHLGTALRRHQRASNATWTRNGIKVVKFFLNLSKGEQKQALPRPHRPTREELEVRARRRGRAPALGRLPAGLPGHHPGDVHRRAPWYVIPADRKWMMRALVSELLVEVIDGLPISEPTVPPERHAEMARARADLLAEG